MTEFEEYQEHTQYTHNAFCRIVIRHASIDAARKLYSKWKREISLEYLSEEKFMPFAATDEYFAQPPSSEEYPFTVCGQTVMLSNTPMRKSASGTDGHAAQPDGTFTLTCADCGRKWRC